MFHRKYEKLSILLAYEELSEKEKQLLSKHLLSCAKCKELVERTNKMVQQRTDVNLETRLEPQLPFLRSALHSTVTKNYAPPIRRRNYGHAIVPKFAATMIGAGFFLIGAASSYLYVNLSRHGAESGLSSVVTAISKNPDESSIENVRFVSSDQRTGKLDFSFNLVKHYQASGSIDNPDIQKVLAYALVNSNNPGTRIRTVDLLNAVNKKPENDVEAALIKAAESDDNPGVRRAALLSLGELPFNGEVKDAFLYVLQNDPNPGMRVSAINILSQKEISRPTEAGKNEIDPRVLQVLKRSMDSDRNLYVRTKAADILKSYKEM
ncbi:MAG: HEAT repeat domain-containing protein [Bacteroidetes bacterium]|nr:HEAT repeat domain-containing protein [Bacteroidota bacterium]